VTEAGSSPERVLRVTAYVVGVENWPVFNRIYAELFGAAKPARTVVPVPELHHGYLVEIEAVASRGI
jgi:2-iminobutanoate/2-iminopropanoate deaminase